MENLFLLPVLRSIPSLLSMSFEVFIPRELEVARNTEKSRKYGKMIERVYYPVLKPTVTNIDGVLFVSFTYIKLHETSKILNFCISP
jgi:hypothetical protein